MFEASVNGELYDPARWAKYYRPWGFEYSGPTHSSKPADSSPRTESKPESAPAESKQDDDDGKPPFNADPQPETKQEQPVTSGGSSNADDILAKIRNRR